MQFVFAAGKERCRHQRERCVLCAANVNCSSQRFTTMNNEFVQTVSLRLLSVRGDGHFSKT
jgi:hypothetical protein